MKSVLQQGPDYIPKKEAHDCLDIRISRDGREIAERKSWVGEKVG